MTGGVLLRVLCLNLRFGRAPDGPNSWHNRTGAVADLLRAFPADLLAFQEANDFQVDFLAEQLAEHRPVGRRSPAPDFWQNNVLFCHRRLELAGWDHFYLSPTPRIPSRFADSRWPRQCTIARLAWEGLELVCATTHFDFDAGVQRRSARMVLQALGPAGPDKAAVVMGDFNAAPHSPAWKVLVERPDPLRLCDAFGGSQPPTHHRFTGKGQGPPIDWVLYRGPLKVRRAMVVTRRFDGRWVSDHFPLYVEFQRR